MSAVSGQLPIEVTQNAKEKLHAIFAGQSDPNAKLRIYITGGGCAGLQYGFALDAKQDEDDTVIEFPNQQDQTTISLVIDAMSYPYLQGSVLDHSDHLMGSRFTIDNPHAEMTCSCGSSFSISE